MKALLHMRPAIARRQLNSTNGEDSPTTDERKRFDAEAFYFALDAERLSRQHTWKRVAQEAQVSASTLSRMAQGRRPDVDSMAALVAWSGLSADAFVRGKPLKPSPGSLSIISTQLKSDPHLTPEAATALDELLKAVYDRIRTKE